MPVGLNGRSRSLRVSLIALLAAVMVAGVIAAPGRVAADERDDLLTAVRAYFDAEVAGDTAAVWRMLAPSSPFKKAYSYEMYLLLVKQSHLRVKSYMVEEVLNVTDNIDREGLPKVEKIGRVRVHVILTGEGGPDSEQRSEFTFLKEAGQWLKG